MANSAGYHSHGSQGGKYARKRTLDLDFSALGELAERLENLGASLEETIGAAMEKAGEEVQQDTLAALATSNLPAKGKYSKGQTEASVVRDIKVEWSGSIAAVSLGFDKTKEGAGEWLITGTPKMQPDKALQAIYGQKSSSRNSYEKKIMNQITNDLNEEIKRRMGE